MKALYDVAGPAYARDPSFWKVVVYSSAFQGIFLGAVGVAFVSCYTVLAEATWFAGDYKDIIEFGKSFDLTARAVLANSTQFEDDPSIEPLLLGNGEWWWIGLLALAGLCVGIVKVAWNALGTFFPTICKPFPFQLGGLIVELSELESEDPYLALPLLITSVLSIGLGASVGPEAALSASGSALGELIGSKWRVPFIKRGGKSESVADTDDAEEQAKGIESVGDLTSNKYEAAEQVTSIPNAEQSTDRFGWEELLLPDFSDRKQMCVLEGMSASIAALFPASYISTLLVFEVGNHWHWGKGGKFNVTETVASTGLAATFSYGFFGWLMRGPMIKAFKIPNMIGQYEQDFEVRFLSYGALIGIVSALIGFGGFIVFIMGVKVGAKFFMSMKRFFVQRLGWAEDTSHAVATVVAPVTGGALLGLLCVGVPLCMGNGSEQLYAVMTLGRRLGAATVTVTAFAKLLCLGVAQGFGFVGGPIFPLVFAGACTGSLAHIVFPNIPVIISFASGFAAAPVAIIPGIFSITSLASVLFLLGGAAASSVFVACVFSYMTVCGMGLLQAFVLKGMEAAAAKERESQETENEPLDDSQASFNPLLQRAQSGKLGEVSGG